MKIENKKKIKRAGLEGFFIGIAIGAAAGICYFCI